MIKIKIKNTGSNSEKQRELNPNYVIRIALYFRQRILL